MILHLRLKFIFFLPRFFVVRFDLPKTRQRQVQVPASLHQAHPPGLVEPAHPPGVEHRRLRELPPPERPPGDMMATWAKHGAGSWVGNLETLRESKMACWKMDHKNQWFSYWNLHLEGIFQPAMFDETRGKIMGSLSVAKKEMSKSQKGFTSW